MNESFFKDRKAVAWLRTSTEEQADKSLPDQLRVVEAFAAKQGVEVIDSIELPGVSGSNPRTATKTVDEILRMRDEGKQFDTVLVYDLSRFTRSGPDRQAAEFVRLRDQGVQVVDVSNWAPRNRYSSLLEFMEGLKNNDQARQTSLDTARGQQQRLGKDRPHCTRTPWGIDRLISDGSGTPLYKLRRHGDGTVVKVDLESREEYEPIKAERGQRAHEVPDAYQIDLVPGREDRVDLIEGIFRRSVVDGWGPNRIAKELNDLEFEAPDPKGWSVGTVKYILDESTTYLGFGIANRRTKGRYSKRSDQGPIAFDDDNSPRRLTAEGNPVIQFRPEEDWKRIEYPALRDFLPTDLRERVLDRQIARLRGKSSTEQQPKSKHADSGFILTGILKTASGVTMRGIRSGRANYRYYGETRHENRPKGGRARRIRAEVVETIVMGGVIAMLRGLPDLEDRIVEQTLEWVRSFGDAETRSRIEEDLAAVEKQQASLVRNAHRFSDSVYDAEAERLADQHAALSKRLGEMGDAPLDEDRVRTVVRTLIAGLVASSDDLPTLPNAIKKRAVRAFVEEAVFDQAANEISLSFRTPSWAQEAADLMGLDSSLEFETSAETHQPFERMMLQLPVPKAPRRKAA